MNKDAFIFDMSVTYGFSYSEIAKELGITKQAVHQRLMKMEDRKREREQLIEQLKARYGVNL